MRVEKELLGDRIRMRNYMDSDLAFVTSMWFDTENGKYMSDPTAEYVDDTFQKALDTLSDSKYGYYLVIEDIKTGEKVGSFCMFPDENGTTIDIGYCILKSRWRQGYASEAIMLALDWLCDHGGVKVTAEVAVDNIASNALLRKMGFEVEKTASFKKYNMDISFDSYIYAKSVC